MKTYKLIKEYPGSPKLGYIISFSNNNHLFEYNGIKLTIDLIENCYKEFWQRIFYLADEFQVLELKYDSNLSPTSPKGKFFNTKKEAERYHESLQFKFEIGKWYESSNELFYCTKIKNNCVYGYGVDFLNNWVKNVFNDVQNNRNFKIVSQPEVKQFLLEYAKLKYSIGDKIQFEKGHISTIKSNFKWSNNVIIDENNITKGASAIVYNDGTWIDIIEKPLFKDKNGKFWYKSDFKQNEIYYTKLTDNTKYLLKFDTIDNNEMFGTNTIDILENDYYTNGFEVFVDIISIIREATQEETNWLEKCEKANKFVEKKEIELPKTWKEYANKNPLKSKLYTKHIGLYEQLDQLLQLRDVYRNGWRPNWDNEYINKQVIKLYGNTWVTRSENVVNCTFTFQTKDLRDKFFENFKDLLEEVKPLFI